MANAAHQAAEPAKTPRNDEVSLAGPERAQSHGSCGVEECERIDQAQAQRDSERASA